MADIQAFPGIRYDLGHVGALSEVVAPPYDVIDAEMQDELYKRHPANVIRLILNRVEPGDDDTTNRYSRAARFLKNWISEGLLQSESRSAIYVYHQVFEFEGQQFTRRGFMSRVRLEPFGEGKIYPHEETHAAAKADRLHLIKACQANLSQIFGIYSDTRNAAQQILEDAARGITPLEATDHLGVIHRLWPVTDEQAIAQVVSEMGPKELFIADGHHRYETACNYQKQLAEAGELSAGDAANYVLMMCVSMDDPGMIVLPTHRLLRGLPPSDSDQLKQRLADFFDLRSAGEGADLAPHIWEAMELEADQGTIALFTARDQRWTVASINTRGRQRMDEVAAEQSEPWRGLGVAILHRLILQTLLGAEDLPTCDYVHRAQEVADAYDSDGALDEFPLAALVMPASLDHIRAISHHGERMPAKSTYFYPKLLSGLVINPLT